MSHPLLPLNCYCLLGTLSAMGELKGEHSGPFNHTDRLKTSVEFCAVSDMNRTPGNKDKCFQGAITKFLP